MSRVLVPLAQGCEEIEAVTVINVLRRAGLEVISASLDGRPVKGARGITVVADVPLDEVKGQEFAAVVLPGGQPGTDNLKNDPRVIDLLERHAARGAWTAAVCAAPGVLAVAGLLRGKRATSYPGALDQSAHGGTLLDAPVVVDGRVLTGRSAGMAMDFALEVVAQLLGTEKRDEVEAKLVRR
jgi:4-methyl-5(b-hydroxyethyl)-thiazole monophosphate biosynthesis